MATQSRVPVIVDKLSIRSLRNMRSEGCLKGQPEPKVRHLRSMGQLSPPPDEPPPPLPPGFTPRPLNQTQSPIAINTSDRRIANMHRPLESKSCSRSSSTYSEEPESEVEVFSPCNRMLNQEHTDQEQVVSQLCNDAANVPNLKDLGYLLRLSASLKQMGASFSKNGEMLSYGNPPSNEDFEEMLDIGAKYDALWHDCFTSKKQKMEHNLWPALHVLKKMLQNEGVAFDDLHSRLDHGSGLPKLVRLGDWYDVIREEWYQKTLSDIHPALRWDKPLARAEIPNKPVNVGWSFARDELPEHDLPGKHGRTERSTTEEEVDTCSSSPNKLAAIVSVSVQAPNMTHKTAPVRPLGLAEIAPALLHGPSPLQRANTASTLIADDMTRLYTTGDVSELLQSPRPQRHDHTGVLGLLVEDERRRAKERQDQGDVENQSTEVRLMEEEGSTSAKDGKKSKGVKKWLRSIFENSELARSMDRMGRSVGGDF